MRKITFKTENKYELFLRSGNAFHLITHVLVDCSSREIPKGTVSFEIKGISENIRLCSEQNGVPIAAKDLNTTSLPHLPILIKVFDGTFFQLSGLFFSDKEANDFMQLRNDASLIDITELGGDFPEIKMVSSIQSVAKEIKNRTKK